MQAIAIFTDQEHLAYFKGYEDRFSVFSGAREGWVRANFTKAEAEAVLLKSGLVIAGGAFDLGLTTDIHTRAGELIGTALPFIGQDAQQAC